MADPLSIAAGSIGIVVPALHGARLLLDDLRKITGAPKAVQELEGDVDSLCATLGLLGALEESTWTRLGDKVTDQSRSTCSTCATACNDIRGDIQRWTKRSKGGTLSWRDRVNVGFFKERHLTAHVQRLQSYKLTLTMVMNTATLYSSVRNAGLTEEVRKAITDQQRGIAAATERTGLEVADVERKLAGLRTMTTTTSTVHDLDDLDELDTTTTILGDLLEALQSSRALLQELASRSEETEIAKVALANGTNNTITFGANNRGMQQGIVHGVVTWNVSKG